jgi:S1-C subfamily serine protease
MMRPSRWLGVAIFALGVLTGGMLAVGIIAPPKAVTAQDVPALLPTPTALPESLYAQLDLMEQVTTNLYERVSPSVVHITSRQNVVDFFYGTYPQEGTGSGFIYDDQGHILTNNHVIERAEELDVLLSNGQSFPASVIGTDPYYDLAVLKIDLPPAIASPLELGDSSVLKVGQTVIAIGNPFGLDRTLTTGVISALGRRIETGSNAAIGQAIQTDAAINPGNSGGPLLDSRGRVVGINTAINSPSGGSVGIGFAVPVNIIKQVVPSLIADGRYAHPSLGVRVGELGTEVTPGSSGVERGLLVVTLEPGGAGEQAGLQAAEISVRRGRYVFSGGDIIVAIGGKAVVTRNDMLVTLEEGYRPGDAVDITVVREDQTITVTVTLGAQ